ncbi:MAG: hypothetical protein AAGG02_10495 [Cyanobacteria bacterium P01_H01_bin.15]
MRKQSGALALIIGTVIGGVSTSAIAQGIFNRPDFFERGQRQLEQEIRSLEQEKPQSQPDLTVESQDWKPLVFREAGFSVWMPPGLLSQETETLETEVGTIKFQIIGSDSADNRYVAAYSRPLDSTQKASPDSILVSLKARLSEKTKFELADQQPLTFQDHRGQQLTFRDHEKETIVFQIFLVSDRIYLLGASQPGQKLSATGSEFFETFKLL